ncbi:hypothetical protein AGMMS49991_11720 [Spirochaetia bacterium]|nr:hypothetical protein AGMMS49991_11720 [Spirochaetia bacterium]
MANKEIKDTILEGAPAKTAPTARRTAGLSLLIAALVMITMALAACNTGNDTTPAPEVPTVLEDTTALGTLKSRAALTSAEKTAILANINGAINSADFAWFKANAGALNIYVENGTVGTEPGLHLTLAEAQGTSAAIATKMIAHFDAEGIYELEEVAFSSDNEWVTDYGNIGIKKKKGLNTTSEVMDKVNNGFSSFSGTPQFGTLFEPTPPYNLRIDFFIIIDNSSATTPYSKADGLHFPLSWLLDSYNNSPNVRIQMENYVDSLGLARAKPLQKASTYVLAQKGAWHHARRYI